MSVKLRVRGQTKPPDCRGGAIVRRMGENGKGVGVGRNGASRRFEGGTPSIEIRATWDDGGMPSGGNGAEARHSPWSRSSATFAAVSGSSWPRQFAQPLALLLNALGNAPLHALGNAPLHALGNALLKALGNAPRPCPAQICPPESSCRSPQAKSSSRSLPVHPRMPTARRRPQALACSSASAQSRSALRTSTSSEPGNSSRPSLSAASSAVAVPARSSRTQAVTRLPVGQSSNGLAAASRSTQPPGCSGANARAAASGRPSKGSAPRRQGSRPSWITTGSTRGGPLPGDHAPSRRNAPS